jgi:hypothetical protein
MTAGRVSNSAVRLATPDEASRAVAIWREVAGWLIAIGQPLWRVEQFDEASAVALIQGGELAMGFEGDRPAAVMTIQGHDPLFWPEAAPSSALYLHKIAVSRGFAGSGWTSRLIDWAGVRAHQQAIGLLRLDCSPRPGLVRLYEACGFVPVDDGPVIRGGFETVRYQRAALGLERAS